MPIDTSMYAELNKGPTLSELMLNAERMKSARQERELREFQLEELRRKSRRGVEGDGALSDLLVEEYNARRRRPQQGVDLATASPAFDPTRPDVAPPSPSDPHGTAPTPLSSLVTTASPQRPQGPSAFERLARTDPDRAVSYQKDQTAITRDQFKMAQDVNEGSLQILSGVSDQASYDAAKRSAQALYSKYGFNLDDLQLPAEYSPATVNRLRFQAMSTQKQLEQIRADRKLDWDIEDDEIDNTRSDRNLGSLITDRDQRRAETARYHNSQQATSRRGQDMRERTQRRGQDLRPPPRTSRGSGYKTRPTATGPNGQKMEFDGKAWVPVK